MAAPKQRVAGLIQLQIDGEIYDAKGEFSYNAGRPKRDPVIGADRVHGFKETPQVAFIEGAITDRNTLDLDKLVTLTGATATLTLANDKTFTLAKAWYAGEGTVKTGEGEIGLLLHGETAEEA